MLNTKLMSKACTLLHYTNNKPLANFFEHTELYDDKNRQIDLLDS